MRRIIFMHTVAGGGHTSATKAIIEALENLYPGEVETTMIDVLKEYAPRPLDLAPEAYSRVVKAPQLYRQVYEIGDGRRRSRLLTRSLTLYTRRRADQFFSEHRPDAIVSTFHFSAGPVLDALERRGHPLPFINVVTDLVTIPPVWFDARADATVVPTEPAYHQAILAGLSTTKLHRIGMPVSARFVPAADKAALRQQLDWPADTKVALLMAGGDGVGPLGTMAEAIVASGLPVIPAIVTGRNRRLAKRLRSASWASHCLIYDFVEDMPSLMQAADILITKAGPGTIAEALNTHLPMIIYSRIPGQEVGNAEYVTHSGAGYWAPKKRELITTLRYLLGDPDALKRASKAAGKLANPGAAAAIAKLVMQLATGHTPDSPDQTL